VIVTIGDLTKDKSALLDKYISDCVTFGLNSNEALEYIKRSFGSVSERTYFRRRKKLMSEESSTAWLSYFTRIGFVELHKRQTEIIEMIMDDSISRLYEEKGKPHEKRNENLILKLKKDIKESSMLLSEYGLGTPVISAIKARLEKARDIKSDDFPINSR
jgi:hypothetical protein